MARAWHPPLYRPAGKLRRLFTGRQLLIGGLALATVPAAAGAFAFKAHSFNNSPKTNSSASTSNISEPADDTAEPLNVSSEPSTDGSRQSLKVTVNGQDIPVPANGTVNQSIPSDGGNTDVHVESESSGQASNSNSSSLNVNVNSNSSSTGDAAGRSNSSIRIRSQSR